MLIEVNAFIHFYGHASKPTKKTSEGRISVQSHGFSHVCHHISRTRFNFRLVSTKQYPCLGLIWSNHHESDSYTHQLLCFLLFFCLSFRTQSNLRPKWRSTNPGLLSLKFDGKVDTSNSSSNGKHTKNYGKSAFLMGKPTINHHFQ